MELCFKPKTRKMLDFQFYTIPNIKFKPQNTNIHGEYLQILSLFLLVKLKVTFSFI